MNSGMIGASVGTLGGVLGGVIGTYFSIKSTKGPRERAFMGRAAVCFWIGVTAFVVLTVVLPSPYRWFLWIPYVPVLMVAILKSNARLSRLRAEEAAERDELSVD